MNPDPLIYARLRHEEHLRASALAAHPDAPRRSRSRPTRFVRLRLAVARRIHGAARALGS